MESVENQVKKIIRHHLGLHQDPKPTDLIMDDLHADSLDCVEIILEVEEQFEISITDDQAEKAKTVQDIIALVETIRNQ